MGTKAEQISPQALEAGRESLNELTTEQAIKAGEKAREQLAFINGAVMGEKFIKGYNKAGAKKTYNALMKNCGESFIKAGLPPIAKTAQQALLLLSESFKRDLPQGNLFNSYLASTALTLSELVPYFNTNELNRMIKALRYAIEAHQTKSAITITELRKITLIDINYYKELFKEDFSEPKEIKKYPNQKNSEKLKITLFCEALKEQGKELKLTARQKVLYNALMSFFISVNDIENIKQGKNVESVKISLSQVLQICGYNLKNLPSKQKQIKYNQIKTDIAILAGAEIYYKVINSRDKELATNENKAIPLLFVKPTKEKYRGNNTDFITLWAYQPMLQWFLKQKGASFKQISYRYFNNYIPPKTKASRRNGFKSPEYLRYMQEEILAYFEYYINRKDKRKRLENAISIEKLIPSEELINANKARVYSKYRNALTDYLSWITNNYEYTRAGFTYKLYKFWIDKNNILRFRFSKNNADYHEQII